MVRHVPSVMSHAFSETPVAKIRRSVFDRSCGYKTTFSDGLLIPVFVDEVLPGDTYSVDVSYLCRLTTPIHPLMDNMFITLHAFFVPNRLVWSEWENFIGNNYDYATDTAGDQIVVPKVSLNFKEGAFFNAGSLYDHLGIPPLSGPAVTSSSVTTYVDVNALPILSYGLIWNDFYRDENLYAPLNLQSVIQNNGTWSLQDGTSPFSAKALLPRGKRHDYFTSALPFPQKGPACVLPLASQAPVKGLTSSNLNSGYADTSALGGTINELRQALQVQSLLETDARGGTRYTELLLSHFGVVSPDARLQRPEYLGGAKTSMNISPVAQTSATQQDTNPGDSFVPTPQGNLSGIGTSGFGGRLFSKSFVEHGHVIVLLSVDGDLNYQQGLDRMWSRTTRYDYYWPSLAHLGEQPVLNKEIYLQGYNLNSDGTKTYFATNKKTDNDVFGYQERYAEYRYKPSLITGDFRSVPYGSNYTSSGGNVFGNEGSLDSWHLAQGFTTLPTLSQNFINVNLPLDRVLAVSPEVAPPFLFDSYFRVKAARPMPTYSIPGLGARL